MQENLQIREDLIQFLKTITRPGQQVEGINDDVNLIEAGIIDSLSFVELILYFEAHLKVNFRDSGVDPSEIVSISGMLAAIERQVDP